MGSEISPDDRLLWLDVETTGLDPQVDFLLSFAALVTDPKGNPVDEYHFETVIGWHPFGVTMRDFADPYVRAMHDKTGLWDQVNESTVDVLDADSDFLDWVQRYAPEPKRVRVAGNSVRLDLNFTERFLPVTYAHLHYRSVDVSALAYVAHEQGWMENYYVKQQTHNALADIRESLAEFQHVLRSIRHHLRQEGYNNHKYEGID